MKANNMKLLAKIKKIKLDFLLKHLNDDNEERVQELILNTLNVKDVANTDVIIAGMCRFNCIFYTLREYNKALMRITMHLKNNIMISVDWCHYNYIKVNYDEFFTDEYYYVDKVKELEEFVRLVKIFRQEYFKIKNTSLGIQGHNSRQAKRLHTHISDLVIQLIKIDTVYRFK